MHVCFVCIYLCSYCPADLGTFGPWGSGSKPEARGHISVAATCTDMIPDTNGEINIYFCFITHKGNCLFTNAVFIRSYCSHFLKSLHNAFVYFSLAIWLNLELRSCLALFFAFIQLLCVCLAHGQKHFPFTIQQYWYQTSQAYCDHACQCATRQTGATAPCGYQFSLPCSGVNCDNTFGKHLVRPRLLGIHCDAGVNRLVT